MKSTKKKSRIISMPQTEKVPPTSLYEPELSSSLSDLYSSDHSSDPYALVSSRPDVTSTQTTVTTDDQANNKPSSDDWLSQLREMHEAKANTNVIELEPAETTKPRHRLIQRHRHHERVKPQFDLHSIYGNNASDEFIESIERSRQNVSNALQNIHPHQNPYSGKKQVIDTKRLDELRAKAVDHNNTSVKKSDYISPYINPKYDAQQGVAYHVSDDGNNHYYFTAGTDMTLGQIANKYNNLTIQQIIDANQNNDNKFATGKMNITNPNLIYAGAKYWFPEGFDPYQDSFDLGAAEEVAVSSPETQEEVAADTTLNNSIDTLKISQMRDTINFDKSIISEATPDNDLNLINEALELGLEVSPITYVYTKDGRSCAIGFKYTNDYGPRSFRIKLFGDVTYNDLADAFGIDPRIIDILSAENSKRDYLIPFEAIDPYKAMVLNKVKNLDVDSDDNKSLYSDFLDDYNNVLEFFNTYQSSPWDSNEFTNFVLNY